jgi:hypothetical protein
VAKQIGYTAGVVAWDSIVTFPNRVEKNKFKKTNLKSTQKHFTTVAGCGAYAYDYKRMRWLRFECCAGGPCS